MLSFLDMDPISLSVERRLRWFHRGLWLLGLALAAGTLLLSGHLLINLTGRGDVPVPVTFRGPYTIVFPDQSPSSHSFTPEGDLVLRNRGAIDVCPSGRICGYINSPSGREASNYRWHVATRTHVRLARSDTDTRAVVTVTGFVLLASAWTALLVLRRLVASVLSGDGFSRANVRHLRIIGAALLTWPAVMEVARLIVRRTIDLTPRAEPQAPGPSWWVVVLAGVAVLALSEVWRIGVELRDLERGTV
jgi:hypothetical protein